MDSNYFINVIVLSTYCLSICVDYIVLSQPKTQPFGFHITINGTQTQQSNLWHCKIFACPTNGVHHRCYFSRFHQQSHFNSNRTSQLAHDRVHSDRIHEFHAYIFSEPTRKTCGRWSFIQCWCWFSTYRRWPTNEFHLITRTSDTTPPTHMHADIAANCFVSMPWVSEKKKKTFSTKRSIWARIAPPPL